MLNKMCNIQTKDFKFWNKSMSTANSSLSALISRFRFFPLLQLIQYSRFFYQANLASIGVKSKIKTKHVNWSTGPVTELMGP